MSKETTHYRDAWRSAIYDATGDYVKTKRAMELAELNGLFDPINAAAQRSDAGSVEAIAKIIYDAFPWDGADLLLHKKPDWVHGGNSIRQDEARQAARAIAALASPPPSGVREALEDETIQILLDLLNPLHGALDYQIHVNSEGEHVYDAPPDYEHHVTVLAQMDRDLTQAVLILEDRKAQAVLSQLPATDEAGREKAIALMQDIAADDPRGRYGRLAREAIAALSPTPAVKP